MCVRRNRLLRNEIAEHVDLTVPGKRALGHWLDQSPRLGGWSDEFIKAGVG